MLIYKAFGRVQHLQNLTFSDQNSINNSYVFWCLILDVIFWDFGASWCQNSRFWDPLGAQLGTKWRPTSPKWHQKGSKNLLGGNTWNRLALEVVFGMPLGTILVDLGWFWIDFWWFWDEFWMDFGINVEGFLSVFCSNVCRMQSRLARNALKENVNNM